MKTLLTPVDFSPVTARVVDAAAELARALYARIVLLNVTEPIATVVDFAVVTLSTAHVDDAAVKRATERLEALQSTLNARGLIAESIHAVGSPAHEVIEQARRLSADYIVVGSHGHTAFYDLLVGSTTTGILRHASCPVIVVPAATGSRGVETAGTHAEAKS